MTARTSVSISVLALLLPAVVAHAGAPLKGVDVKLGKEPGGGASARTTNVDGKIDLGILPAGSYYLIVNAPKGAEDTDALIEIHGAKGGTIKKRWNYAQKKAFEQQRTQRREPRARRKSSSPPKATIRSISLRRRSSRQSRTSATTETGDPAKRS